MEETNKTQEKQIPRNAFSPLMSSRHIEIMKEAQNYIDGELESLEKLEPRPYKDGWPENKWREEMEKHPFFMTKSPDASDELHPLIEGLQQLKYSEDDNTVDELAETYKKDGLLSFKLEKYRDAVANFSAGLKQDCSQNVKSQLYNNRGAAHFFLKNYRSAQLDSEEAVKLNSSYLKPKLRIAQCMFQLEKYAQCIDKCDEILKEYPDNDKIINLRKSAFSMKKVNDRNIRKQIKMNNEERMLIDAIRLRKINIVIQGQKLASIQQLDPLPIPPRTEPPPLPRVFLEDECLVWPVIFIFPEHYVYECVQSFHEDVTFSEVLEEVFQSIHCEWDKNKLYQYNSVNIYFKDKYLNPVPVSINWSLLKAQTQPT